MLVASEGYTVDEVLGRQSPVVAASARPKRRKLGKAAVKYRDPENRRNSWTGRGSMPRWLAAKVKRGISAADFLIPGLARPTEKKGLRLGQKTVFKPVAESG
ncbi:H-NS family nucleoid-associated regulatory protein [Luteimonas fraxinea]